MKSRQELQQLGWIFHLGWIKGGVPFCYATLHDAGRKFQTPAKKAVHGKSLAELKKKISKNEIVSISEFEKVYEKFKETV